MPRSAWIAVGVAAGALALAADDRRAIAVLLGGTAALLALAALTASSRRRAAVAAAIGVAAVLARGVLGTGGAELTGTPEGSGPWMMVVESIGSMREGEQVATLRTLGSGPDAFRVAATLPPYPAIEPGDHIEVDGRVRARPDSPYGGYLARLGAWGTLDARSMRLLGRPSDPRAVLERARRAAGDLLTRVLPEPEAGLAAGILIGLRDRVDRSVSSEFTTAGVSHVVAISGWNIAIVAAAIATMAGRLGRRRRSVVTVLAIVAYIAFAGASPSVLRAGAMAGVVLLARESGRAGRAAAALGWAATALLLVDPGLILDAGFQLSTLATAGLIAWALPLTDRLDRWTGGHLPRWLSESLGVSFAAQVATLPVVLASFGRLALIAPLVNLFVVPLVAPAMAAGVVALLAAALVALGAPAWVGAVAAAPAWVALRAMVGIVDVAAALPFASLSVDPLAGTVLGFTSVATGGGILTWRRRARRQSAPPIRRPGDATKRGLPAGRPVGLRLASGALIVVVAVTGGVVASRGGGVARVTVLDIGQGDAILIEGSRGGRLLVDGGPDPERLLIELDRRIPPWDRRIDAIVLSHPHEDHVAGLALLLDRYRVTAVFEAGTRGLGPGYAAWTDWLTQEESTRLVLAAGDRLAVDEIALEVVWPIQGQVSATPPDDSADVNNLSLVLLGTVGATRFLLTGDIEEDVDPTLIARGLPPLDVLKIAHHGSQTATTRSFLEAVRPRVAIASVGAGNRYGHPTRAVLDRLAWADVLVYRTDRDGSVAVEFDGPAIRIRTSPRRSTARVAPPPPADADRLRLPSGRWRSGSRARPVSCPRPAPLVAGSAGPRLSAGRREGPDPVCLGR